MINWISLAFAEVNLGFSTHNTKQQYVREPSLGTHLSEVILSNLYFVFVKEFHNGQNGRGQSLAYRVRVRDWDRNATMKGLLCAAP